MELSRIGDEDAKVAALDLGADDYLMKPFGIKELLARMRVALRHQGLSPTLRRGHRPQRRGTHGQITQEGGQALGQTMPAAPRAIAACRQGT